MGQLRASTVGQGQTNIEMDDLSFDFEPEIDAKDALRRASLRADGVERQAGDNTGANKGRHSQVCRHWLRNLCMKGDKCDFLHQLDPNRMPECLSWLRTGKCTDPDCNFRHVEASERPECQRYRLGFCRYGPMCRSRHDRLPRDAMPEILPDWFIDSLLFNGYLVPRCEDVGLEASISGRGRGGGPPIGGAGQEIGTEQGTIPGLLPPIHGKCRYFLVRSVTTRNIQISAAKGIWATSVGNSQRLRQAFREVDHVIIIFSSSESRNFSGYGKMTCEPDDLLFPGIWGEMSCRLSSNFRIHWIKYCSTPCSQADHIKFEDQPVRRCRDGQELPSSVGERLCRFLWQQLHADLLHGSELEFEPRYDPNEFTPAPRDARVGASSKNNGAAGAASDGGAAPLALEDEKKDSETGAGRARPAPEKLGSFSAKPRSAGAGVAVGKALASGSSSLALAVAAEVAHHGPGAALPGPPPPGYYHPVPPPLWGAPPHDPRRHGPPPGWPAPPGGGYPPPQGHGGYFPPPGYAAPPPSYRAPSRADSFEGKPPVSPFEEGRPPGFWGDRGAPPSGWEGASDAAALAGRNGGGSRSRSHRRRRRKEKGKK